MTSWRVIEGDAVQLLPALPPASVDMVYCDPPYGTQQVWHGHAGSFDDRWTWGAEAEADASALRKVRPLAWHWIEVSTDRRLGLRAYLVAMARLMNELRRVMKPAASLWWQCDDTAMHYLRLVADAVFSPTCFLGDVIWKRTSAHGNNTRRFGRVHDTIFVYGRSRAARHRLSRIGGTFCGGDPLVDFVVTGLVDGGLNQRAKERCGYPTQKPVALLRRLVACGSMPGDVVLDPTCGSGTTLVAAYQLGRQAIGIDSSAAAIGIARQRLDSPPPLQTYLFGDAA